MNIPDLVKIRSTLEISPAEILSFIVDYQIHYNILLNLKKVNSHIVTCEDEKGNIYNISIKNTEPLLFSLDVQCDKSVVSYEGPSYDKLVITGIIW